MNIRTSYKEEFKQASTMNCVYHKLALFGLFKLSKPLNLRSKEEQSLDITFKNRVIPTTESFAEQSNHREIRVIPLTSNPTNESFDHRAILPLSHSIAEQSNRQVI
ncbi:Hypothetical predicted protein [Mytilus galloprovincialis]|uniref:Uncharacterized protein n=1 Tax=Mytilus galloprovincialis TaxID=29158 RepID=A0A8B6D9D0_MYTGA|nr:Hypothetical predicted protein [Mytilus galloprovincialis]